MGEYLDTVVSECKTGYDITRAVLRVNGFDPTEFVLPFPVHLQKGDKITFYLGTYSNPISHSSYDRATVSRRGEDILEIISRDMRVLTEIREAEGRSR